MQIESSHGGYSDGYHNQAAPDHLGYPQRPVGADLGFVGKKRNRGDRPPKFAGFSLVVSLFRHSLADPRRILARQPTGQRQANWRLMLNGIIFRTLSGYQWEQLFRKFGTKSTVYDWYQHWCAGGVMKRIWEELVRDCQELGGIPWEWQAADGWLATTRFGGKRWVKPPRIAAKSAPRSRCWSMLTTDCWRGVRFDKKEINYLGLIQLACA